MIFEMNDRGVYVKVNERTDNPNFCSWEDLVWTPPPQDSREWVTFYTKSLSKVEVSVLVQILFYHHGGGFASKVNHEYVTAKHYQIKEGP